MMMLGCFFVMAAGLVTNASALTKIYSGRNIVDLDLGSLSGYDTVKYILTRDVAEIRTWQGTKDNPLAGSYYHADSGCAGSCTYQLVSYQFYSLDGADATWHQSGASPEVRVSTDHESGILHNGPDWQAKLGRYAVVWDKEGAYTIDGVVTIADGALSIIDRTVNFWGIISGEYNYGPTRITFADGARLEAVRVAFSCPQETAYDVNIEFNAPPAGDAYNSSYLLNCTLDKVRLSLNGHHGADFKRNTFHESRIESYDTHNLTFKENQFTAATTDSSNELYFGRCNELTFENNRLTSVGMTLDECNKPLVQGNTAATSHLSYTGNEGVIKGNNAFESASIHGADNLVEGNTIVEQLSMYSSSQSIVKGNSFSILAIHGSNNHILDNTGKRIEIRDSGNSIIRGNQLSCLGDVESDKAGIDLAGGVTGLAGNTIENNRVEWCDYGIHLYTASGANTIKQNNLLKCATVGIYLENSSDNHVENNAVNETGYGSGREAYGIQIGNYWNSYNSLNKPDTSVTGSKRNVVVFNSIWGTYGDGINFPVWPYGNDENGIHENTIEGSTGWAVYIGGNTTSQCGKDDMGNPVACTARNIGNIVYNNIFKNNAKNAHDIPANETSWNHAKEAIEANITGGSWLGGNYWDNYNGADADGDGIGDTSHEIRDASNNVMARDNLPLMTGGAMSRLLVAANGDSAPVRITSQGEATGAKKYIDALWLDGAISGDFCQVFDAGATGTLTIKATGGFGIGANWTGCDETTGNGTADAFCIIHGPLASGDRVLTASIVKTPYRFLRGWGAYGTGNGQFNYPAGMAADSTGNIYAADKLNNRIQKFDGSGVYLTQWGSYGTGNGQFNHPVAVAVDPAGNIYVADGSVRIQKFDSQGNWLLTWGSPGSGDGQFRTIRAIALDSAGENLYVADIDRTYIQVFSTTDGSFKRKWWLDNYSANKATGLAVGGAATADVLSLPGYTFVAQDNSLGINKYGSENGYRRSRFGNATQETTETGKLNYTFHLAIDKYNHLYVIDSWKSGGKYDVKKFDYMGNFIEQFGSHGTGDGQFQNAFGITVDTEGNVFVSEGYPAHRIQVFTASPVPPVKGDVNGDGRADLADVILSLQVAVGVKPGTIRNGYPASGADVNGDKKAGLAEALFTLQGMAELRVPDISE